MTSADIVELHVNLHCHCMQQAGEIATDAHKCIYRESLEQMIKLAIYEFIACVNNDAAQVNNAIMN